MLKRAAVLVLAAACRTGRETMHDARRKAAGVTGFDIARASAAGCLGNAKKDRQKTVTGRRIFISGQA
jgi:hypothetical protein